MVRAGREKRLKTDRRDARLVARCLRNLDYSPVYVPSEKDESVKDYIRAREDETRALQKVKQRINALCARKGLKFTGTKTKWTQKHESWLQSLKLDEDLDTLTLKSYLNQYFFHKESIKRFDEVIEATARLPEYRDRVSALTCFKGINTLTALALVVEVCDFARFSKAGCFAAYLGLTPGERSSGAHSQQLGLTKQGNRHLRRLLIQAAQSYTRGSAEKKSALLEKRREGQPERIVEYAERCSKRLQNKFLSMVLGKGKARNKAVAAIARELACFVWGVCTGNVA